MIKAERTLYLLLSKYIHITLIIIKAMRNIGLAAKQSVTFIIYGLKHWVIVIIIFSNCDHYIYMKHTIFISVLIGFRYIRASESLIHRITCCTYGVLYGGDTILVCRLVTQMHISGMHLTMYIVNITSLSFHLHCHITDFKMIFFLQSGMITYLFGK